MNHPAQLKRVPYASRATGAERCFYLYLPNGYERSEQLWPVLLFLHGNGERGDGQGELDFLLKNGPLYEAWIQKRDLPFIIVAPQLPMYGQDAHADYLKRRSRAEIPQRLQQGVPQRPENHPTDGPMRGALADTALPHDDYGPPMGWPELEHDLVEILDQVLENYRADPARQYLSGVSYGGFGTWYMASRYPERFAALLPVVGFGHTAHVPAIAAAKIPIWCFAGGRDRAVEVRYFYPALNLLEELGHRDFRFTIEADMGHDVWTRVYASDDVYSWLARHRKAPSRR